MKKNNFFILIIFALFLFLFGCIQMEMDLDVNEDGTASTSVLMDVSGMSGMMGGMMGMVPQDQQDEAMNEMNLQYSKENICDTLMESRDDEQADQMSSFLPSEDSIMNPDDVTCTAIDDFVARLDYGNVDLVENGVLEMENIGNIVRYTLTLSETEALDQVDFSEKENNNSLSFEEDGLSDFPEPNDFPDSSFPDFDNDVEMPGAFPEMGPEIFEAMGMSMKMNISMPGTIVSVTPDIGELNEEENILTINLLKDSEELNENGVVIVSEKEAGGSLFAINNSLIIIGGIGLLVVLIIAGVSIILSKKKKKPDFVNEISKETNDIKESPPKTESQWDADLPEKEKPPYEEKY